MTEIGRCLVFYLKYFPEMQALYEKEGALPEIDKRPDAETILSKTDTVGRQAGCEAADLLLRCTEDVRSRIEGAGVATLRLCRRKTIQDNWQVKMDVLPPRGRRAAGVTRQLGLYLEPEGITPWFWSRGGRAAEDRIRELLRPVPCLGSKQKEWEGGSVALPATRIPWQDARDFVVDAEPVIGDVRAQLNAITPEFISAMLAVD